MQRRVKGSAAVAATCRRPKRAKNNYRKYVCKTEDETPRMTRQGSSPTRKYCGRARGQ